MPVTDQLPTKLLLQWSYSYAADASSRKDWTSDSSGPRDRDDLYVYPSFC